MANDSGDMASIKERAFVAALWKVTERFGAAAITIIVQVVLARLLTPFDFGVIAIVVVFTNLSTVFVQSGLNTALVREDDLSRVDCSTVFWTSFLIAVALYGLLWAFAPNISDFYSMPVLVPVLRVLGLILIVNSYNSVQTALLQRSLRMKAQLVATLIAALISGFIGIVGAIFGAGVWALVAQMLLMQIVSCVVMAFEVRWRPYLAFSVDSLKRLFGFGWKLLASSLLHSLYVSLYDLVVGKVFSGDALGYFSQGKKYPSYAESILDNAVSSVVLPTASLMKDSLDDLRSLMRRAIQIASSLAFPVMLALCVSSRSIVVLILGPQWEPSAPFFAVFCVAFMFTPITRINLQCFNAMGRSDLYLKLEVTKKLIGSVMILAAASQENLLLLAFTSVAYSIVALVINMSPSKKLFHYSAFAQIHDFFWPLITSLVAAVATWWVGQLIHNPWVLLFLQPVFLGGIYVAINLVIRREAFLYTESQVRRVLASLFSLHR